MKHVWQSLCRAITGSPSSPRSKTFVGQTWMHLSHSMHRSVETISIMRLPSSGPVAVEPTDEQPVVLGGIDLRMVGALVHAPALGTRQRGGVYPAGVGP